MVLSNDCWLVDTSVWISYLDRDDALSKQGKKLIKTAETSQQNILVSDFIIQEVLTVLLYKNKAQLIETFLEYINSQPHITIASIDSNLLNKTFKFIQQKNYKPKISFTDWSLLFLAQEFDFILQTFDKQLTKATSA